jgi:hypothetical protein
VGALTQWGISKERVAEYEKGIRAGGILLGVKPRSDADVRDLVQQWTAAGGQFIHS